MAVVFIGCTALFYWMLTQSPALIDIDAMYHFKVARLIRERGPWVDISWLPFTVLGERGPDHHWLFHALLAPLTLIGADFRALALACAIAAAAMPAAILPFLRRAGVPLATLFCLAAMFSSDMLPGRFLELRAQNLAVILMVAALFAMVWRKSLWIGIVAFLFTQAYHGAVILAMLLAATLGAQWLQERIVSLRPVTAVAIGVLAGLVASPWFPKNVDYLVFHTFFKAASGVPGLVGGEWLQPPWSLALTQSLVAHLHFASGIAAAFMTRPRGALPRLGQDTLACCAMTLLFLAMYHFAWRFVEYYAPFAVISAGLLWRDAFRQRDLGRPGRRALALALVAALGWGFTQGFRVLSEAARYPFEGYADMMRYIEAHDPQPLVFNTRWSDFQQMIYWSDRARYVSGLDGHYLLYGDPPRFKVWFSIANLESLQRNDNARRIRETFDAGWVVVSQVQAPIAESLARDEGAELVMATPDGWLFRLKPRP
jgi:hypothetical protein